MSKFQTIANSPTRSTEIKALDNLHPSKNQIKVITPVKMGMIDNMINLGIKFNISTINKIGLII